MSKIKYSVIVGENRRIKAKEELDLAEQVMNLTGCSCIMLLMFINFHLQAKLERTAKFYEFEQQFQRQAKMLR